MGIEDAAFWAEVKSVVADALEQPLSDRERWVHHACGRDLAKASAALGLLQFTEVLAEPAEASTETFAFVAPAPQYGPGMDLAGRFRILRFLASGGMGDVYEAEDMQLEERVALKTIRPEVLNDGHTLSRFKREIQYAKRVTHPNVCRIHDLGSHREGQTETVFLTMELLTGETLARHLRRGPMAAAEARAIAIQMAEGLAAAHSAGVIHRDFKPSNVMLTSTGAGGRAVVTDFGLARSSAAADGESLTGTGKLVGTPAYMAPEQLLRGEATPATDVYALGLVMYEMVTGRKPFQAKTTFEAAMKRMNEAPAAPSEHTPDLDLELEAVILRCLERDPARRFQTGKEVAHELANQTTGRQSTSSRTKAAPPKNSLWLLGAVALLMVIAAVVSGVWVLGRHRPPEAAVRWYEQGTRALREGTSFSAMNAFERAVQIDPDYSLAHARLAEAATDLDYMDKAKSEMLKASPALQSFFLSREERLRLEAVYFVLTKDFAQAAARYKELAGKVAPQDRAAVLVDLGSSYESGGKFSEALASFSESIGLDRQYGAAFLRRAVLEGRQRQNDRASADFDAAEQIYQAEANAEGITEVLYQRSVLFRRTGKLAEALGPAEKALELARSTRDEYHQIRLLLMLSYLHYTRGDVDGGRQQATDAIDLSRQAGIDALAASGLVDVGNALFNKGDYEMAEGYLRSALQTARRFQSVRVEARAELTLGQVLVNQGKTDEGIAVSKQAIEHFEESGDKSDAARAAIQPARTLRDEGDYNASAQLFRDQIQFAERANDNGSIALGLQGLGSVLLLQESYPEALKSFGRSADLSRTMGDISMEGYSEANRAEVLWRLGRYKESEDSLQRAEALDRQLNGNAPLLANIFSARTGMDLSELKFDEAEKNIEALKAAAGRGFLMVVAKRMLGLQRLGTGRAVEGLSLCKESLEEAKVEKNASLLKNSELALAEAQLASRDRAGALALASGLAAYFGSKGQQESELRALSIAVAASSGVDRARYLERGKATLGEVRRRFGDGFVAFSSRPDVREVLSRAGLTPDLH